MDVTGHRASRHAFTSHLFRTAWGLTYMRMASMRYVQSMMAGLLFKHAPLYMDVLHWQPSFQACAVQRYRRIDPRRRPWKSCISSPRVNRTTGAYGGLRYRPHHLKRLSWTPPSASLRVAGALDKQDLPLSHPLPG